MKSYYYDLHLHSCLSPCAEADMTPGNIAGMLKLAGIQIAALTDHNSAKNCPAFFAACRSYGLIPVAGMELTTSEEIHLVCLFEDLDSAIRFDRKVDEARLKIPNRPEIFGAQSVCNSDDEFVCEDEFLLSVATRLSLDEAYQTVHSFGGTCYPAHIDRESGGILAILGALPPDPPFCAVELRDLANLPDLRRKHRLPPLVISSSDSHFLTGIPDAGASICLSGTTEEEIRRDLIRRLNGIHL